MYMIFSVLCQIFICICYSLALYYLTTTILNQKLNKQCYFTFCITFTLIQVITNLIYASVYKSAAEYSHIFSFVWNILLYSMHAAILVFFIMRTCRTRAGQTAAAVAVSHFAVFTVTLLSSEFIAVRVSPDNNFILFLLLSSAAPHLFGLIGSFLIAAVLKKLKFHRYFTIFFTNKKRTAITLTCSIFLMHYHTLIELTAPVEIGSVLFTLCSGLFIILALIVLLFAAVHTSDREKIRMQEEIILQQQTHLSLLEELQQEMRTFRHDYTNLMAGVSCQAQDGDFKGIQEFMKNTGTYFDEKLGNEIKHLESISNVKIDSLQSMITSKIAQMKEQNIAYVLEVINPVTEPGIRVEDLLRCLGILIDNAIEETVKSEEKTIKIILLQRPHELYAAVSNTCAQKPNLAKMQEKGYSVKGINRGTGLSSLRRIISEYKNCVTRMYTENKTFIHEIKIVLK